MARKKEYHLHRLKRPGLTITVYSNRVHIRSKRGCLGPLLPKETTIPMRSIANVEVVRMTETLIITTMDGTEYKYRVGGLGGAAKTVRDAILETLP